jgi:hypothetical protein
MRVRFAAMIWLPARSRLWLSRGLWICQHGREQREGEPEAIEENPPGAPARTASQQSFQLGRQTDINCAQGRQPLCALGSVLLPALVRKRICGTPGALERRSGGQWALADRSLPCRTFFELADLLPEFLSWFLEREPDWMPGRACTISRVSGLTAANVTPVSIWSNCCRNCSAIRSYEQVLRNIRVRRRVSLS